MGLEELRGDDPRLTAAREGFFKWNSCKHSLNFEAVEIEVKRTKKGVKYVITSGMCALHDRRVDFGEKCLRGGSFCYQKRKGPSHEKTAVQKHRTKKALLRRQKEKERERERAHLQKSINEFGDKVDSEGPPAC